MTLRQSENLFGFSSPKNVFHPEMFGFLPETFLPLRGPPYYAASEISLRQSRSREFRPSESAAAATNDKTVQKYMERDNKTIQQGFSFQNIEITTSLSFQLL